MEDKQKAKLNKAIKAELYKHIYYHLEQLEYAEVDKRDYSNYTEPATKNKDKHITPLPKLVLIDMLDIFIKIGDLGPYLAACSKLESFDKPIVDSSYFHCVYIELSTKAGLDKPKDAADSMCAAFTKFIHRLSWLIACCLTQKIKLSHPLFRALSTSLGLTWAFP